MRARLSAIAVALLISVSHVNALQADLGSACILAAAERLPRIPGMVVGSSRTTPVPPDVDAKLDHGLFHALVEIDAVAAGRPATFRFFCVAGGGAPANAVLLK